MAVYKSTIEKIEESIQRRHDKLIAKKKELKSKLVEKSTAVLENIAVLEEKLAKEKAKFTNLQKEIDEIKLDE